LSVIAGDHGGSPGWQGDFIDHHCGQAKACPYGTAISLIIMVDGHFYFPNKSRKAFSKSVKRNW
jgi:hypothetical protein